MLRLAFNVRFIGDVMFLNVPMQPLLVVDSAQAVTDLLEKRSHLYSDRLQLLMPKLFVIHSNF